MTKKKLINCEASALSARALSLVVLGPMPRIVGVLTYGLTQNN